MQMVHRGNDPLGWIIIFAGSLVTLWTVVFAIRALIAPGETQPDHPKRLILKDDR